MELESSSHRGEARFPPMLLDGQSPKGSLLAYLLFLPGTRRALYIPISLWDITIREYNGSGDIPE